MAPSASSAPLSRKMFQHFAIITAVITNVITVFADGQGDNVLGKAVAAQQAQAKRAITDAARRRVEPVTLVNCKIHDGRKTYAPLNSDSDGGYSNYG